MFFKKKENTLEFKVYKMTCGHCEAHLKNALESIDGIKKAVLDRSKESAVVTFEKDKTVPVDVLVKKVIEEGYEAEA